MKEIRLLKTIAHFVFLFLFVYAAYFYLVRLYSDTSFFTFKILAFEKFNIEAGRYTSFLSQIIPLILIKLHAGLKTVLMGYSVSIVLVFYGIFLICLYTFSSLRAGLLATTLMFLGVSDTSMYAVTEIFIGMMFSTMFYAFLEYYFQNEARFSSARKSVLIGIGILIVPVCMFSHPSTLFPVLFILIFQAIDKNLLKNKVIFLLIAAAVVTYGLKYLSIDKNSYEGDQISTLNNLFSILGNFTNLNSLHFFMKFVFKGVYVLPLVLFGITLVFYSIRRDYTKLAYSFAGTIGFFVLLMVIFSRGESDLGMEKNLIPLWIFIALPFIHDVLFYDYKISYLKPAIFALVVIAGLSGFYRATVIYGDRLSYIKQIIESASTTTNSKKIIIEKKNLNMDRLAGTWSIANESLLISSVNGPQFSKTIYLVDNLDEINSYDMQRTDVYLCVPFWREWGYSSLNPVYFQLPREPYKVLETAIPGN
jgi:hypothetical protein